MLIWHYILYNKKSSLRNTLLLGNSSIHCKDTLELSLTVLSLHHLAMFCPSEFVSSSVRQVFQKQKTGMGVKLVSQGKCYTLTVTGAWKGLTAQHSKTREQEGLPTFMGRIDPSEVPQIFWQVPKHSMLQDYIVGMKLNACQLVKGFFLVLLLIAAFKSAIKTSIIVLVTWSPLPPTKQCHGAKSKNHFLLKEVEPSLLDVRVGFDATELDQSKSSTDASQEENKKGTSYSSSHSVHSHRCQKVLLLTVNVALETKRAFIIYQI